MTGRLIVGLDLSIAATGICDTRGEVSTVGGSSGGDERLVRIGAAVYGATVAQNAELVVIEDLQSRTMGNGVITHLVHGVVRHDLTANGVPYALVPAATLKLFATGKGNADKTEMALAAYKVAGVEFADDDQCDAWWLRVAGFDALGEPLYELPARQRDALHRRRTKNPRKGEPAIPWATLVPE